MGEGYSPDCHFNSIKVRLERFLRLLSLLLLSNFNSIKVRLEPFIQNIPVDHLEFQFHKGAIRTLHIFSVCSAIDVISIP